MMTADDLVLIQDTREPDGGGWAPYFTMRYVRDTLPTFDLSIVYSPNSGLYSAVGLEPAVMIERKAPGDLRNSLIGKEEIQKDFDNRMRRAQHLHRAWVYCECERLDFMVGNYIGSEYEPRDDKTRNRLEARIASIQARYPVTFHFFANREEAAMAAQRQLYQYIRIHLKLLDNVQKANRRIEVDKQDVSSTSKRRTKKDGDT